jgi:acetyl-CoA carboxylase carboxyl transferase subunit beta
MVNWLQQVIKAGQKIKTAFHERATKADQEASLWTSCTCLVGPMLKKDLEANLFVCPSCNKHHRIKPYQRFDFLFGKNNYEIMDTPHPVEDPLGFVDSVSYKERLKKAKKKTGLKCSMVVSTGSIKNIQITAIASDFDFMGASMGSSEGEAFLFAAQHAIEKKQPLLIFTSGGGMKMQESLISLSQMTRTTLAINEVKAAGLPYIVVLTDATAGGITASYGMLGDLHLAEPNALVAFAGARVIKGTVKEDLPEGFQRSEYLLKTGFVDLIVERKDLASKIETLLSILLKKNSGISSEQNETAELSIQTREAS